MVKIKKDILDVVIMKESAILGKSGKGKSFNPELIKMYFESLKEQGVLTESDNYIIYDGGRCTLNDCVNNMLELMNENKK